MHVCTTARIGYYSLPGVYGRLQRCPSAGSTSAVRFFLPASLASLAAFIVNSADSKLWSSSPPIMRMSAGQEAKGTIYVAKNNGIANSEGRDHHSFTASHCHVTLILSMVRLLPGLGLKGLSSYGRPSRDWQSYDIERDWNAFGGFRALLSLGLTIEVGTCEDNKKILLCNNSMCGYLTQTDPETFSSNPEPGLFFHCSSLGPFTHVVPQPTLHDEDGDALRAGLVIVVGWHHSCPVNFITYRCSVTVSTVVRPWA